MKIKQIVRNGFWLHFDNGLSISTIWGSGSYSDNHDLFINHNPIESFEKLPLETTEVEVMLDGKGEAQHKYIDYLHKKHDGDGAVIGYLPLEEWFKLIVNMKRWKPTAEEE